MEQKAEFIKKWINWISSKTLQKELSPEMESDLDTLLKEKESNSWVDIKERPQPGSYLCFMGNGYAKMCYYDGVQWTDMWKNTMAGHVKYWMVIPNTPLVTDKPESKQSK